MKKEKVSILGCGWLGEALMENLSGNFTVSGSKTTVQGVEQLSKKFNNIFLIKLDEEKMTGDKIELFLSSGTLVVSISPGRKEEDTKLLPGKITALIDQLRNSPVEHVIFISSTSVYPFTNSVVDESCFMKPDKNSGVALLESENLLLKETQFITTVLRFGGLIGYNRTPGKFLAGKENIENPDTPVNLIHRDDCIGIIRYFILNPGKSEIYNACAPLHPRKRDYYSSAALAEGLPLPQFDESGNSKWKQVSTEKLIERTGYTYIYPDPCKIPFQHEIKN